MTGTVKFFNGSKGYGFITNDETSEDVFVHVSALDGLTLQEGDKVEYVEEEGKKGSKLRKFPCYNIHYDSLKASLVEAFFMFFFFEKSLN